MNIHLKNEQKHGFQLHCFKWQWCTIFLQGYCGQWVKNYYFSVKVSRVVETVTEMCIIARLFVLIAVVSSRWKVKGNELEDVFGFGAEDNEENVK